MTTTIGFRAIPTQSSTAALPFHAIVVIVALFVFVAFPVTVIGAIIGRNTASDFQAPCRTTRVPRQVLNKVELVRPLAFDKQQMVMWIYVVSQALVHAKRGVREVPVLV